MLLLRQKILPELVFPRCEVNSKVLLRAETEVA